MRANHALIAADPPTAAQVHVAVMMTAVVKLMVNMDKDMGNDEMPPVVLGFVKEKCVEPPLGSALGAAPAAVAVLATAVSPECRPVSAAKTTNEVLAAVIS